MKSIGRNIFIFLIYVSLCFSAEEIPVVSNREVFFSLSDSIINSITILQLKQHSSISLKTSNDTFTNYFRQHFINSLVSNKKSISENTTTPEPILELSVKESSVFFGESFTESFLGNKKSERRVQLTVLSTLKSSIDGNILFSEQFTKTKVDTVNLSTIEQMNNSSLPMTNYQMPTLSFFDSILEPAIVIFSTGIAIYLFFTIRS